MMENLSKYFWLRRSAGVELQFFQIAMIGRGRLRLCLFIPGSLWQFTWNRFSGWIARSAFSVSPPCFCERDALVLAHRA